MIREKQLDMYNTLEAVKATCKIKLLSTLFKNFCILHMFYPVFQIRGESQVINPRILASRPNRLKWLKLFSDPLSLKINWNTVYHILSFITRKQEGTHKNRALGVGGGVQDIFG